MEFDNSLKQKICNILSNDFILYEEVATALMHGLRGGKNVLFFGRGGHGKSLMTRAALEGLGLYDRTFSQSFGSGFTESKLYGGTDISALKEEGAERYLPEQSFLAADVAIFEEFFDAPTSVLTSLKNTLMEGRLENGDQTYEMQTDCIIALTNVPPSEVAERGDAYAALVDRFPIQLEVEWDEYSTENYESMLRKVIDSGPELNGHRATLAELASNAYDDGVLINPRSVVQAAEVAQTAAADRGSDKVECEDLLALRFCNEVRQVADRIEDQVEATRKRRAAKSKLDEIQQQFDELLGQLGEEDTPIPCLQVAKRLQALEDRLADVSCPDSLVETRDQLRTQLSRAIGQARDKAEEYTRV